MNVLACNMRSNFASGMPSRNVSQKMQFHHAAAPSIENLIQSNNIPVKKNDKHFQNPNIFNNSTFEKNIPSSYKHLNHSLDKVQEKNSSNCCDLILDDDKQTNSDSMLIKEPPTLPVEILCQKCCIPEPEFTKKLAEPLHMEAYNINSSDEMSCSDSDDDSLIEFDTKAGPSFEKKPSRQSPIIEFIDEDESDDDDEDIWGKETLIIHNSNHDRNRQSSLCESEDSFIVFDDGDEEDVDEEEMNCDKDTFVVFADEDSEEDSVELKQKTNNGKKVSFAEGAELCTVHLMIKWSFAYQKARKGLWEQFARDNARFKYRANTFGMKLNKFLQPEHRQRVYDERFRDRQE